MNAFNIKLLLSTNFIVDSFFKPSNISDNEKKTLKIIEKNDYDYNETLKNRKKIEVEVLSLQENIKSVKYIENFKLIFNTKSLGEIHKYENLLRNQLKDIKTIIIQLKRLIENEYLDLFFDIKMPFKIFEEFLNQLKNTLKQISLNETENKMIYDLISELYKGYNDLIDSIVGQIISDFGCGTNRLFEPIQIMPQTS